jgi:hypothetical protein
MHATERSGQGSTAQAIDIVEVPPARDQPCQGLTANGRQPVIEAAAKLSSWLSSREAVARVARHLRCTPEAAERQIVGEGKSGRLKARGVIENQLVSPLPAAWNGTIDLAGTTMKPPEVAYEITNFELCFIDLVAAGLLPAPAEKAWWLAAEANAYLVKGVPLPWAAWQVAGAAPAESEQAAKELARLIGEDRVPAWGRRSPQGPMEQMPGSDLRIPGFTWVIRPDGDLGTSPPGRLAAFLGAPRGPAEPERRCWYGIEVDAAALRRPRPRPLTTQAEPPASPPAPAPDELPQADPAPPSAPKKRSRKKLPHGGAQTRRTIKVLNRIFPEGRYPDENEMAWTDVWIKFGEEYSRYVKEHPSNLNCPSQSTVRRAMGRPG